MQLIPQSEDATSTRTNMSFLTKFLKNKNKKIFFSQTQKKKEKKKKKIKLVFLY